MKEDKDVSSTSTSGRRVRPDIATRIRTRASGGSNGGSGSGRSSGDSGSNPGTGSPGEPGNESSSADISGGSIVDNGSTRVDESIDRSNRTPGSSGSGRNISAPGSDSGTVAGNETRTIAADISVTPSTLKVTDIITNDNDGLVIKDGKRPGRKPGATTGKKRTAANSNNDLIFPLKVACGFLFSLPATFLHWGKHWELSDDENEELATNIKNVLDQFPSQTAVDFLKYLDKYMPVIVLGMSLYQMIEVRYKMTVNAQHQQVKPVSPTVQHSAQPEPQMVDDEPIPGIISKKLVM